MLIKTINEGENPTSILTLSTNVKNSQGTCCGSQEYCALTETRPQTWPFPVSTLPVDDGHRAFLSTMFKEPAVLFEMWETKSNWFYPWARFSDFSRHMQFAKKSARVVVKPGHFHGVCSYHISKASDKWLREGRRGQMPLPLASTPVNQVYCLQSCGALTTMPAHFFTYKCKTTQRSFCYLLTGLEV